MFSVRAAELLHIDKAKSIILYVDDDSPGKDLYMEISREEPRKLTYKIKPMTPAKAKNYDKTLYYAMTQRFFKEYGLDFANNRVKYDIKPVRFRTEGGKLIPDKHGDRLFVRLVEKERKPRGPRTTRRKKSGDTRDYLRPFPEIDLPETPWAGDPVPGVMPESFDGTGLPSNRKLDIDRHEEEV